MQDDLVLIGIANDASAARGRIERSIEDRNGPGLEIVQRGLEIHDLQSDRGAMVARRVGGFGGGDAGAPGKAPAVPARKSVTPDFIICLEDGKKLKMLKRYLRARYGLTPDAYRAKWNLPADYPMTAPNYAAKRSEFAKQIGLGKPVRKKKG